MRIVVGADHRGYELKNEIAAALTQAGHETLDVGTHSADSVDYPDYARAIGGALTDGLRSAASWSAAAAWAPASRRTRYAESAPPSATTPTPPAKGWSTTT